MRTSVYFNVVWGVVSCVCQSLPLEVLAIGIIFARTQSRFTSMMWLCGNRKPTPIGLLKGRENYHLHPRQSDLGESEMSHHHLHPRQSDAELMRSLDGRIDGWKVR